MGGLINATAYGEVMNQTEYASGCNSLKNLDPQKCVPIDTHGHTTYCCAPDTPNLRDGSLSVGPQLYCSPNLAQKSYDDNYARNGYCAPGFGPHLRVVQQPWGCRNYAACVVPDPNGLIPLMGCWNATDSNGIGMSIDSITDLAAVA